MYKYNRFNELECEVLFVILIVLAVFMINL